MHIAYLDDDDEYSALLMAMLNRLGHKVWRFRKPDALMTALEMELPVIDAFVTDFHMPGINGGEVVVQVLKKFPALPCAVISTDDAVVKKHIAGAITSQKPYEMQAFKNLIERIFAAR